nr:vasoactive intestinal polypeptide receptor 1 isoform X2 [Odocoileus virginianus texanus]
MGSNGGGSWGLPWKQPCSSTTHQMDPAEDGELDRDLRQGGWAAGLQQEECDYLRMIAVQHEQCLEEVHLENETAGCGKMWDNLTCWPATPRGQVVVLACPLIFKLFSPIQGRNVSRSCTEAGWTPLEPGPYPVACGLDDNSSSLDEQQTVFYSSVKTGYTIGYSLSLATLLVATAILSLFRKLHCTRNYIHMHLFISFILRAAAVFIKDLALFNSGETDHCSKGSGSAHHAPLSPPPMATWSQSHPTPPCSSFLPRPSVTLDLPREGRLRAFKEVIALLTKEPISRWAARQPWSYSSTVSWPTSSGCWWRASTCTPCSPSPSSPSGSTSGGVPSTFTLVWTIIRIHFEDYGCWDTINSSLWWIIKAPILASILVNFILFIRIIGILVQKLRPPDVGKSDSSPYSRLAKSTLLLIPLFGVHYIMFAFFPDNFKAEVKMVFELVVGSFQGFVVAILYCFLNGEVQAELRRKWRRWHLQGVLGWDPKYQHPSAGSNGATCSTQVSMLTRVSPGAGRSSSFQAEVSQV